MTRAGTTLGRYHLLDRLGAGGMGEVWRARDANLDREVAIKLLTPGTVADAETQARLERADAVRALLERRDVTPLTPAAIRAAKTLGRP